jgi:2-hydroxy-3-oxopropionate reductase
MLSSYQIVSDNLWLKWVMPPKLLEACEALFEEMRMLKVGYIGLGIMGKSIARNILRAGFPLVVHNRSRASVQELVAGGAAEAFSPAEVAARSDVVFTNLPDSPDVEKVVLGHDGIIEQARSGQVFVDNSTIKPAVSRLIASKLAEKGMQALDAPVSGGDIGARDATLSIMVGGPESALETVRPLFSAMGKTITHVGDAGAGQVAKAANQIMVAAQMTAMAELLIFSQKAGVDPRKVIAAIKGGAAQCWTLDVKPQRLFSGNRQPGFKAYMQAKDLNIVLETAREYGVPMPATAENTQLFEAMLQMGMAELDNSAVIGVIEALAGVKLEEK